MRDLSFDKNIEYSGFIDYEKFTSIADASAISAPLDTSFRVVISDNNDVIKSCLSEFNREFVMALPVVAILKDNVPYAMVRKCISRGATALLIKMEQKAGARV